MRNMTLAILALLAIFMGNAIAQNEANHLLCAIPSDAKKLGPINTRDPHQVFYNYFPSDAEVSAKNVIGRETYYDQQLVDRELYKNGERHGVQREWYPNGTLKSESPYKDGAMDGAFNYWNEKGELVGQYEINNGLGTKKIYDGSGLLVIEQELKDSLPNGLTMEVSKISKIRTVVWMKNGNSTGIGYSFYSDDSPYLIAWAQGPLIYFAKDGAVSQKVWQIKGREVSETEYATAASSDPSLPPYYADGNQYKRMVGEDVRALLEKYRTMPRVKIPLQFDQNGNPVLAQ